MYVLIHIDIHTFDPDHFLSRLRDHKSREEKEEESATERERRRDESGYTRGLPGIKDSGSNGQETVYLSQSERGSRGSSSPVVYPKNI